MANQFAPRSDGGIEQIILRDPVYNELRNIHFAQALPWGPQRLGATYATTDRGDRWSVLRRNKSTELAIPAQVDRDARLRALRTLTSSVVGLPSTSALKLTEDACIKLLANRMISKEKRG